MLFVSADRDLRDVVTRVLEREGYEVAAVDHSGHALLRCRLAPVDVLVAELSGPDMSGPSLAERIRRHCPAVGTLYLANAGTLACVQNVLVRPFARDELVEGVRIAALGLEAHSAPPA